MDTATEVAEEMVEGEQPRRRWARHRGRLGVRNRDLVVIVVVALVVGIAVTFLTAYLGVR